MHRLASRKLVSKKYNIAQHTLQSALTASPQSCHDESRGLGGELARALLSGARCAHVRSLCMSVNLSKKAFTSVSISSRWTAPSLSQVVRLLVRDSVRQSVRVSSLGFGYLVRVTDRIRATTTAQPVCVYFSLDRTRRRVLSQNTQNTWQMWQRNCLIPTVKCRCKPGRSPNQVKPGQVFRGRT